MRGALSEIPSRARARMDMGFWAGEKEFTLVLWAGGMIATDVWVKEH